MAVLAVVIGVLPMTGRSVLASADDAASDSVQIATVLHEMNGVDPSGLQQLPAITIAPYTLPEPSVDVMRVELAETYTIDGVGTDKVNLQGWIAVRHGAARAADAGAPLSWDNSLVDTEFVGLDLHGQSDVFGLVQVRLDPSRPAVGQVGRIEIPKDASRILLASNDPEFAARALASNEATGQPPSPARSPATSPAVARQGVKHLEVTEGLVADRVKDINIKIKAPILLPGTTAACRAPVAVSVLMPDLGLEMKTKTHATWYSLVDTIPPVGHRASVTVEPIRLVSAGREVGTLISGVVSFREVVRRVSLEPSARRYAVAADPAPGTGPQANPD